MGGISMWFRRIAACCVLGAFLTSGCVTPKTPPEISARRPAAAESPAAPPRAPLQGRVICIDPGHGGPAQPGAVAPSNGLRESDVNLRVALRLRELLTTAGATVVLTRDGDYGLIPEDLSKDLAARAEHANTSGADLFVSVHHNADIVAGSDKNDLEVYYKLHDDGPSLDLAQCLIQALASGFRTDAAAKLLLPGNYKVLRLARIPAVLLEASYMTNAENAAFLSTHEAIEAEASAITDGLTAYFALDPPRISAVTLAEIDGGRAHQATFRFSRGIPIEGKSVTVLLGGESAPGEHDFTGASLVWTFKNTLDNGVHHAELFARNFLGAAVRYRFDIAVARSPVRLEVTQRPESLPRGGAIEALYEVLVTDAFGLPVTNETRVMLDQPNQTAAAKKGVARFYLPTASLGATPLTFSVGPLSAAFSPNFGSDTFKTLRVRNADTQAPVAQAVVADHAQSLGVTTPEGWFAVPAGIKNVMLTRAGYEPRLVELRHSQTDIKMEPVENGILHGRRIALDAAYGGRNAGLVGARGTRACDINLDIVLRAAAYLRDAGAEVILTRSGDVELTDAQRLTYADKHSPELLVSVTCGAPVNALRVLDATGHLTKPGSAFAAHYPKSVAGQRLARSLASELRLPQVAPSVAYLVQQMGCPAVLLQAGSVADAETEHRLGQAENRRRVAFAVYRAIITFVHAQRNEG